MLCKSKAPLSLIMATLCFLICGCCVSLSGGRLNFDDLKYPVSMSRSLYDSKGQIVVTESDMLKPVKFFKYTKDYWSTFYSIIPLSGTSDIVERMNKEIEEAGGDGMTDVSLSADFSELNSAFPLNLLPIWPGRSKITIIGTIVKLTASNSVEQQQSNIKETAPGKQEPERL